MRRLSAQYGNKITFSETDMAYEYVVLSCPVMLHTYFIAFSLSFYDGYNQRLQREPPLSSNAKNCVLDMETRRGDNTKQSYYEQWTHR